MLRRRAALLALALLLAVALGAAAPRPGARPALAAATLAGQLDVCGVGTGTGSISGQITAADTGKPLSTTVFLYSIFYDFIDSVSAASDGSYTFTGLAGGRYLVSFLATSGYQAEVFDNQRGPATFTAVQVNDGAETPKIDAALEPATPGGSVSGRVTAADTGQGLSGVVVYVRNAVSRISVAYAFSDATGAYTVTAVPSGSYIVEFSPPSAYAFAFYNGKATYETADLVVVTAPSPVSGLDAALQPAGRISGRVTAADTGQGLANVSVYVRVPVSQSVTRNLSANTDATGNYTVSGLPAGSFSVQFDAFGTSLAYVDRYYNNKADATTADRVAVTAGATTGGINASLARGAQISGRVTGEGGAPLDDVTVSIEEQGNDENFTSASVDATGVYTSEGLAPGAYLVSFRPFDAACDYIPESYNDKLYFRDATPVTLSGTTPATGIDAALARGSVITGRVTNPQGAGVSSVDIDLYDSAGANYADGDTAATGYYRVDAVPSGTYKLGFDPSSSSGLSGSFFSGKATLAEADPLSVSAPEVRNGINAGLEAGVVRPPNSGVYLPLIIK